MSSVHEQLMQYMQEFKNQFAKAGKLVAASTNHSIILADQSIKPN